MRERVRTSLKLIYFQLTKGLVVLSLNIFRAQLFDLESWLILLASAHGFARLVTGYIYLYFFFQMIPIINYILNMKHNNVRFP